MILQTQHDNEINDSLLQAKQDNDTNNALLQSTIAILATISLAGLSGDAVRFLRSAKEGGR